jgi:hypothetical protein
MESKRKFKTCPIPRELESQMVTSDRTRLLGGVINMGLNPVLIILSILLPFYGYVIKGWVSSSAFCTC